MSSRRHLPQLDGDLFLTDGGIETVLIFHEGIDLPEFAAFDLLKDDAGTETLRRYYLDEENPRDIAEHLDTSAAYVMQLLSNCRKRAREIYCRLTRAQP